MKNFVAVLFAMLNLIAFSQIPDYVPADGLAAWYDMNGGTLDSSPNENHGIPTGVSAYPDRNGIEGGALWFNGSGDHITVPYSESIGIQAEFSSTVWVYLQGGGCNPRVYEIHESLNCGGYTLAFNGTSGNPRTFHTSNFGNCQLALAAHSGGSASVQPGEWHHIAVTFAPGPTSNGKLYVDGVLVNEATHSQDISGVNYYGAPLYIGNIAPNRCDWYGGGMDELGFWEKVLSPEEIWSIYQGEPLNPGCTDETACNFNQEANSDDGNCIPSGCMDAQACNYNEDAECEGEACDYTCCPGPGCCDDGTVWSWESQTCVVAIPAYLNEPGEAAILNPCYFDSNGNGLVEVTDLMNVLSVFGLACGEIPEAAEFSCGDPVGYNGYDYETVQIGDQCWFAENVRYLPHVSPSQLGNEDDEGAHAYVIGYQGTSTDEAKSTDNYQTYGALYSFLAVQTWELCPSGWHIGSSNDWSSLVEFAGGSDTAASVLKSAIAWQDSLVETDDLGFSILPGGYRHFAGGGNFYELNQTALFWSSDGLRADFVSNSASVQLTWGGIHWDGNSARCIKDAE